MKQAGIPDRLHTIPDLIKSVLADAERQAKLLHAEAIHDRTGISDIREAEAQLHYEDLCMSVLVCTTYDCYERIEEGMYCPGHTVTEDRCPECRGDGDWKTSSWAHVLGCSVGRDVLFGVAASLASRSSGDY